MKPSIISSAPSACVDEPDWKVVVSGVVYDLDCSSIAGTDASGNPFNNCDTAVTERYPVGDPNGKTADTACCACGGGDHQAPDP